MKNFKLMLIATAVCASSSAIAANHEGKISYADNGNRRIEVNIGTEGEHAGKAAIKVVDNKATTRNRNGLANNKFVSFSKIDKTANKFIVKLVASDVLGKDKNDVTVAHMFKMKGLFWDNIPKMPDHSNLGRMSYGKVGNLDVYYGDWDNTPNTEKVVNKDTKTNNYTVFYSGTGKTTNMPTSGTATYTVKGINQHYEQGTAVLNGSMRADFGKKTLNGSLSRPGLSIAVNNATINTAAATFGGANTAVANGKVRGEVKGAFFGNNAAGLAGIADFGKNNPNNTAFGGTKN